MFRLKKWEIALFGAVILSIAVSAAAIHAQSRQAQLAEKTVRLHVLANSDSQHDQAVKLQVKDAVYQATEEILQATDSRKAAERALEAALPKLEAIAGKALSDCGEEERVSVSLETAAFPLKSYDGFALPAGEYRALRVVIGEGKGHNWWCVVYPPLCAAACESWEETAIGAGFSQADIRVMQGTEQEFVLRSRIAELFSSFTDLFR